MAEFDYAALDPRGRTVSGVVAADGVAAARLALERRRLVPLQVEPAAARRPTRTPARIRTGDLSLVTRQLASLVASMTLEEALHTVGSQAGKRAVRETLLAVHAHVVEGFRLSEAMSRLPRSFPALYRAMVAAGEGTGALPAILERLADLLERQQQVRSQLTTALAYPAALAVTAVGVVLALMAFVVPRVVEQFDSMGRELPWLTRFVVVLSELIGSWGLPLLGVLVLAGVLGARVLRRPGPRLRFDTALLRLPLFGRLLREVHAARMARTLAIMLESGLPVMEGLAITARTVGNRRLRLATESMAGAVREGGSLSAAMRRAGVFPPTLLYMAASGEDTGRPGPMLERAADYLEREFQTFTRAAMSLLEPAIIVVLGGVVAVIVLSILLPILQFNTLVLG